MAAAHGTKFVIYAALAGNLAIALTKLAAAAWTGSSAMISEGVHSLVDTSNQALLLYGIRRSKRPPDERHPLGHGRELYFWSFIVALLIFSLGAGVSLYEGISHIRHPVAITDAKINYIVLAISFVFELITWTIAWRAFSNLRGSLGLIEAVKRSRDPTSFLVLFEDSAALIGILIALAGTVSAAWFDMPELDGVASVGIAILLSATAIFLARESKSLLLGESARQNVETSIRDIVLDHSSIDSIGRLVTVHLSPDQIVVALDAHFKEGLSASAIEKSVTALDVVLRARNPNIVAVFLCPRRSGL